MTKEQRELLLQAKLDAQQAVKSLNDNMLRAACSRSYYAMFYVARAILLEQQKSFKKHSALIDAFGKRILEGDDIPREFHRHLIDAFEERGTADYDFTIKLSREEVQIVVDNAKKFVELGDRILGDVSLEDQQ